MRSRGLNNLAKVNGVEYVVKKLPNDKLSLKATNPMKAKGYTLHNTYNDASALNEIKYMQFNNPASTSYTFAVDNLMVVQGLPLDRNGWHAGDGSNGYGNRNTWGVEICYSKSGGERYDQAETNAILFVAQGLYENGWDISKVWKHKDWSGKNCPHRILARSRGWQGILDAIQAELDKLKGRAHESKPKPKPEEVNTPTKGIETLAREVIAGKWGYGAERKRRLGDRYTEVQKRVNEKLRGKTTKPKPAKGIDTLAREVIAGKHGDGDARKRSLGHMYSSVQKRVNELSGGKKKSKPKGKSLATLVDEVNRGLHGDGAARKKSLGADYDRVQKEMNRLYKK